MPSLTQQVAALIEEIGQGTVQDILADLEGYTRKQVMDALRNAAYTGLILCDGPVRAKGSHHASPGVYRPKPRPASPCRAVRSVFELAQHDSMSLRMAQQQQQAA